jgi:hypothetical protein
VVGFALVIRRRNSTQSYAPFSGTGLQMHEGVRFMRFPTADEMTFLTSGCDRDESDWRRSIYAVEQGSH